MSEGKFRFGNIVVVEKDLVGVIVKSWESLTSGKYSYEVYVRSRNHIRDYTEDKIRHYLMCKELSEDELQYYK